MTKKIGFFVGSLRKDSYNRKVAEAFANMLPEGYEGVFIKIDDLPFYNEDLETPENAPVEWSRFRDEVKELAVCCFFLQNTIVRFLLYLKMH